MTVETTDSQRETPDPSPATAISWLVLAAFVVVLNETIMLNAMPTLLAEFRVQPQTGQWLSSGFMLVMATVIPTTGWLLQRLATRAVFTAAMTTFCLGTLVCGLAPSFGVLLLGRVVQGAGSAVMLPLTMWAVMTLVPPDRRGRIMGFVSMSIAAAPAVGPTVSGVVLETASWRWNFGLVLPVAVAITCAALRRLPNLDRAQPLPLDIASVPLIALGVGPCVYGLSRVGTDDPATIVVALTTGAIFLAAFARRQRQLITNGSPLLDLRTLHVTTFVAGIGVMATSYMVMIGVTVVMPTFLQGVLQLSAFHAGLIMLPGGVALAFLSPVFGTWLDRKGPRTLVIPGSLAALTALVLLSRVSPSTHPMAVCATILVLMSGCAAIFTPTVSVALGAVPRALQPHGSALLATTNQAAAAAGSAVFIAVMSFQSKAGSHAAAPTADAVAGGVDSAFVVAACLACVTVSLAFLLVRTARPAPQEAGDRAPARAL